MNLLKPILFIVVGEVVWWFVIIVVSYFFRDDLLTFYKTVCGIFIAFSVSRVARQIFD